MLKKFRRITEKGNKWGGWILAGSVVFSGFLIAAVVVPRTDDDIIVRPTKPAAVPKPPAPAPTATAESDAPAEVDVAADDKGGSTDSLARSPWQLPRRLPTPRECFKQKAFNPYGLKLDQETHNAMEQFLRERNTHYEDLYKAREELIETLAKDKIRRREYELKKPAVAKGYAYGELATIEGKKTMVYLEIAPSESAEIDGASAELVKVFRQAEAEIREYIAEL